MDFQNIFEHAPIGIQVLDAEGRILSANPALLERLGYNEEEYVGRFVTDFEILADAHDRVGTREAVQGLEVTLRRRDGEDRHVRIDIIPVGDTTCWYLHDQPSSMSEPEEERIRAHRDYAQSIIDTVREPMLVLDADLQVDSASRSFYRVFQTRPEETEGRLLFELGHGQWNIPALRILLSEILPENDSFDNFEVEHEFPDIGRRTMLLNARKVYRATNNLELILLAIEDITALKREQREREEVEINFTSLVKNIKDHAIFTIDTDGRISSWNVAAEAILGYTEQEALGQPFSVVFTPEDRRKGMPEEELREAREIGRREDERWHLRKEGERFWAFGIVTPMHDSEGNLIGYSKILRDTTERKRIAEQLRDADRRKSEFLAILAHELRNPLAAIHTALDLLGMEPLSEEAEHERAIIDRQAWHLKRMIDDLMDMTRLQRGRLRLSKEAVDLNDVIKEAVETIQRASEGKELRLVVSPSDQPLPIDGDPTRLVQVLINLLTNAIRHTETGGRIGIEADRVGEEAEVRVWDTGIGIEPEVLPEIFDQVVQGQRRTDRSGGGLGIGLVLVKNLTELHGGSVSVHSPGSGKGSAFTIRLPLQPASVAEKPSPPPSTGRSSKAEAASRRRILIVDDNADAADTLGRLLERFYGQEVRVVHNGRTGLEAVETFRPEVVLLDLGMPCMDGFEVARRLRQSDAGEGVLLIALTGWGTELDQKRTQDAGFDHHLVKPVEPEDILDLWSDQDRA